MVDHGISEYSYDHDADIHKQYIPNPTDTSESSEVANKASDVGIEGRSHVLLEVLQAKVSKSSQCCQSRNAREYPQSESRLAIYHVEDVDVFDTYRIVKILTPEGILEIDDIRILGEIIVENLPISNYSIIFLISDIDPGLCLLGICRL